MQGLLLSPLAAVMALITVALFFHRARHRERISCFPPTMRTHVALYRGHNGCVPSNTAASTDPPANLVSLLAVVFSDHEAPKRRPTHGNISVTLTFLLAL